MFTSFAACTGTDVGNGVVDVDFAIYDSNASMTSALSSDAVSYAAPAGIVVTSAWVVVERIRFRDASNCDGDNQLEFVGPFAIDMLNPGIQDSLGDLSVPLTNYCRFEFRWDAFRADELVNAPTELVGASILIQGKRSDDTPFVVRSDRGDEVRLDAVDDSFSVDETTGALFVALDIQLLFDGVDLDSAVVNNGTIRIEDGINDDLLAVFDDNVIKATKLFDDNDGDKELDPEERDETDILAE